MAKVSVNLSEEVVKILQGLAALDDISVTEVIRRAIGQEKFFRQHVHRGGKVLIEHRGGKLEEVVYDA